mmetsp:Transcript_8528/g.33555  ORF Transcript_8528/g.33555 Transcript_8528/m.33555 type:complete len:225 (+) Transcript_8528:661-1335(+)
MPTSPSFPSFAPWTDPPRLLRESSGTFSPFFSATKPTPTDSVPPADEGRDWPRFSSAILARSASTASFARVTAMTSRSTAIRSCRCAMTCLAQRMPFSESKRELAGSAISARTMRALRPSSPIISRVAERLLLGCCSGRALTCEGCASTAALGDLEEGRRCREDAEGPPAVSSSGAMSLSQGVASLTGTGRSSVRNEGRSSSVLSSSRCHAEPSSKFSASFATE